MIAQEKSIAALAALRTAWLENTDESTESEEATNALYKVLSLLSDRRNRPFAADCYFTLLDMGLPKADKESEA